MLPNHPTLVVAEQFAMLEALHPGRIDLGIGRAPGADPMTAAALRRTVEGLGADDFPAEVVDVLALLGQHLPAERRRCGPPGCPATPVATSSPQVWLLGSSTFSAELAGSLGLPFSYAHHFNTGHTLQAADAYRRAFRPSPVLDAPRLMVSASVLVADSEDEAALPGRSQPGHGAVTADRPSAGADRVARGRRPRARRPRPGGGRRLLRPRPRDPGRDDRGPSGRASSPRWWSAREPTS